MKPTDIQIGDLLTFEECLNDEAYPVIQVTGILQDSFFARIDDAKADDELDYKGVIGISLTAEILEKNGFCRAREQETSLSTVYMSPYPVRVCEAAKVKVVFYDLPICGVNVLVQIEADTESGGGVNNLHSCDIEYVHQLQHALRLCGIEKEIVV